MNYLPTAIGTILTSLLALYLIALCVITLVSVWLAAETHLTRLGDGDEMS